MARLISSWSDGRSVQPSTDGSAVGLRGRDGGRNSAGVRALPTTEAVARDGGGPAGLLRGVEQPHQKTTVSLRKANVSVLIELPCSLYLAHSALSFFFFFQTKSQKAGRGLA